MSMQRPVLVSQSWADVQHELQPQRRRPVPQRLTHVPLAQYAVDLHRADSVSVVHEVAQAVSTQRN